MNIVSTRYKAFPALPLPLAVCSCDFRLKKVKMGFLSKNENVIFFDRKIKTESEASTIAAYSVCLTGLFQEVL